MTKSIAIHHTHISIAGALIGALNCNMLKNITKFDIDYFSIIININITMQRYNQSDGIILYYNHFSCIIYVNMLICHCSMLNVHGAHSSSSAFKVVAVFFSTDKWAQSIYIYNNER